MKQTSLDMSRFLTEDQLTDAERKIADRIRGAFGESTAPEGGSVFCQDVLVEGETDTLFGLTWAEAYRHREESILTSDLTFLRTQDLAYLLPAYLLAGIRDGNSDLASALFDLFSPGTSRFRESLRGFLTAPQRQVVQTLLTHWLDDMKTGIGDLPPDRRAAEMSYGWIDEMIAPI